MSELTLLKKRSSSTKPTRIKEGIADFETLAALYRPLEGILSVLDLAVFAQPLEKVKLAKRRSFFLL